MLFMWTSWFSRICLVSVVGNAKPFIAAIVNTLCKRTLFLCRQQKIIFDSILWDWIPICAFLVQFIHAAPWKGNKLLTWIFSIFLQSCSAACRILVKIAVLVDCHGLSWTIHACLHEVDSLRIMPVWYLFSVVHEIKSNCYRCKYS